jgi:hypothetical protein
MRRPTLLALAWLALTGALGPCSLFKPADPEQGSGAQLIPSNYAEYDSTLATMQRAIDAKGTSNSKDIYLSALSTAGDAGGPFVARFDQVTVSRYLADHPTVPSSWTQTQEESFLEDLYADNAGVTYRMSWAPYPPGGEESLTPDRVGIYRKYTIQIIAASGGVPFVEGWARLTLVKSGTSWKLVEWDDRGEVQTPTAGTKTYGLVRLESPW